MKSLHDELLAVIGASWAAQAVHVAATLNLGDALAETAADAHELASRTGADEAALRRLLRALCTINICRELNDGRFGLSEMGQLLRSDHPASLRAWTIWWGTQLWEDWGRLLYSVQTGACARAQSTGTTGFGHLERSEPAATVFHQAMSELTRLCAGQVAQLQDFSACRTVIDVGGGSGEFILTVLRAWAHLTGTVLDQPHARSHAEQHIRDHGLSGRCTFQAGDFFEQIPPGADIYILKSILHDWDDERSRTILSQCRRATDDGGRVLLVERVMPERCEPLPEHRDVVRSDLTMLVALGARERTAQQFDALIQDADFTLVQTTPLPLGLSMMELTPARGA